MGWFEGGEGSPNCGGGGSDMPAGPKLVLLMLLGAFVCIMFVFIGAFGFVGLFYGFAISLVALGFLGMLYGDD